MQTLSKYALSFLHQPYRWGGDDPLAGFDCSGLVQEILKGGAGFLFSTDMTAHDLYVFLKTGKEKPAVPQQGALAFFGTEAKIVHVGFCIDSFRMIEAGGGGSKTLTTEDAIKQNAFVRMRPIQTRKDFVGCYLPDYRHLPML